jgi:hypothetical protein
MQQRLKRLKRITALHEVVERMHSIELQIAANVVREAEQAIEMQRAIGSNAEFDGRKALAMSDRAGWSFAEVEREIAAWKRERLEPIRMKREELNRAAHERYSVSRVKNEQMNRVMEGVAARAEIEEERRMQAATDDRFLSRKLWLERQIVDRTEEKMNVS